MFPMSALLALVLFCPWLVAGENRIEGRRDVTLIGQPPGQWLKLYSLSPYREHWTMTVEVKDMGKDLSKVLNVFSKAGAALTQLLENFPASKIDKTQQLSYRLSLRSARAALKNLKEVGKFADPLVRPAAEPIPLPEIKEKIQKLMAEKEAHAKELSAMPATSALAEELLEHLLMVESVHERTDTEVLLNITIQGKLP